MIEACFSTLPFRIFLSAKPLKLNYLIGVYPTYWKLVFIWNFCNVPTTKIGGV
jgi:hypothetical protein